MLGILLRAVLRFALFIIVFVATNGGTAAQHRSQVEIVPQLGHAGRGTITSATFSPDGRHVLSGGDSSVKLWDVATDFRGTLGE
jgi:WD40 repeat protein